jgi:hypothetical protein
MEPLSYPEAQGKSGVILWQDSEGGIPPLNPRDVNFTERFAK